LTVPVEPLAKVTFPKSAVPNSKTALLAIVKEPVNAVKLPAIVRCALFSARIVPVPRMLPAIVAVVLSVREPPLMIVSDSAFDPV
jgi:hypothetical protein